MASNRRDFIKFVVAGAISAGCPIDHALLAEPAGRDPVVEGEHNQVCHAIRDGKSFLRPPVSARHDVVIVGGGISGLWAARLLRNRDFLLLEKEPQFGGNAYEESFHGMPFATGAAFTDNETAAMLHQELDMPVLPVNDWDGIIANGQFVPDVWGEGLDHLPYPGPVRDAFKKFKREMLAIDFQKRAAELDAQPLTRLLQGYPPELKQWWDAYGPSNWGAAAEDTSALLAVADVHVSGAPDRTDDRVTWPGGNGAISARLVELLKPQYAGRMLDGAATVAVVPEKNEVHVTYVRGPEVKTVAAKGVIMATPKMITARLVEGLPEAQLAAMKKIRYAPYPVINLVFDKPVFNKGYDTWCPGNSFTDFIVADWTVRHQPGYRQKYNILTFYTPLAEDQRGQLLTETGCRKIAGNVLQDFQKLFPGSNVDPLEVHIYRRGHPMFMSTPGTYTQVIPAARQPMQRVFFANTDSEGPVSGTREAIITAKRAVRQVEQRLAGSPRHQHRPVETAAIPV
jgi:monoamine oxidase